MSAARPGAAELLDSLLARRALVYGSLPPHGRDLDLLVREPEERALRAGLQGAGFERRGSEWVRFAACSAEIVELTGAAAWQLPEAELEALFAEGIELAGMNRLVRPSPHHTLLILARRVSGDEGILTEKLRARLELALDKDGDAWTRARERASQWRAEAALGALEQAWRNGRAVPARRRRRPRRGRVIALSGLDGAGKSSQAAALCETLDRLGCDATVVRTRIRWDDSLYSVAEPVKRVIAPAAHLLASLRGSARAGGGAGASPGAAGPDASAVHPVTRLREQSALLTELWMVMITLANATLQWRLMRRALLRGAVVICDRYTLDSIVELRYGYGRERSFPAARAAMRLLYPKPRRAWFLDVTPEAALERKGEWGLEWLAEHRELYLQECGRMGVEVLDGERPIDELCALIAREAWRAL